MNKIYDADEIFEMALELERNGNEFYKKAAEGLTDSSNRKLLLDLAEMEVNHEKLFSDLRKELKTANPDYFDPDGEAALYLHSIANTKIFFKREIDPTSLEDIFKEAILAEKDSTVFYLGMKEMVPDQAGKDKIDSIIKEEMSHIRILSEKLTELKK